MTGSLCRAVLAALLLVTIAASEAASQPRSPAPAATASAPPEVAPATPAFSAARTAFGQKDYASALRYFREGAETGDNSSMAGLAALYALGTGVPANDNEALRWFKRAAANDTNWAPEVNRLLSAGDLHTVYLTEPEMRELMISTRGEFGGLGIEIGLNEDKKPNVVAPIDDTPASHAGLQAGDVFVRIDDQPTDGLSLNEVVTRLRGRVGTSVRLSVQRAARTFDVTITRATIRVRTVKSRLLEGRIGYARLVQFQEQTDQALVSALDAMAKEAGGALDGLVLDLRNDPGGLLTQAIAVTGRFIDRGVVVRTTAWAGRTHANDNTYSASSGGDRLRGAPIVVLVNGASASASEIVAGALQDHKRARVLGTPSFGKGTVQTIFPLDGHGGLKVTTAEYLLPSGRSIQARGVTPDELVLPAEDERIEGTVTNEAKLRGQEPDTPLQPIIDAKLIGTDRDQQLKVATQRVRELAAQRPAPQLRAPSWFAPSSGQQ